MSKKVFIIIFMFISMGTIVACFHAAHAAELGPLHVQNRYPLYLMFLTPGPDTPNVIETGRLLVSLSADYTSLYIDEQSRDWSVLMDMEMTVVDLGLTYGVTQRMNLSLKLPFISMNGGFLDKPLASYHDFFGFPDYGRPDGPVDEFGYQLTVDGDAWFDAQPGGLHPGDGVVSAKIQLAGGDNAQGLCSSLLAVLKIPTGDSGHGFGSGQYDQALMILNRYRQSPLILYLNPGVILLSDPETDGADVSVNNMMTILTGIEYEASDRWSWVGQLNYLTSPLAHTGIPQLDQDSLELALGFCLSLSDRSVLEFAFCEDLTRSAPDFTVHAGIRWTIGP